MSNKEKILSRIYPIAQEKKFEFIKSRNCFKKKNGDFNFKISLLFHRRSIQTAIELFISIEHIPTKYIYKKATKNSSFGTIGN